MDRCGEIVLNATVVSLLRDGLRLGPAREISGLPERRLRAIAEEIGLAERFAPPGPRARASTALTSLGAMLHAALFMEGVDAARRAPAALAHLRTRHDVVVFHAAWLLYRRAVDVGGAPYADEVLDVNAACALFLDRGLLVAEPCRECRTTIWRGESSRAPRGCPVCFHARRLGVEERGALRLTGVVARRCLGAPGAANRGHAPSLAGAHGLPERLSRLSVRPPLGSRRDLGRISGASLPPSQARAPDSSPSAA
jgi:hypothetical protein